MPQQHMYAQKTWHIYDEYDNFFFYLNIIFSACTNRKPKSLYTVQVFLGDKYHEIFLRKKLKTVYMQNFWSYIPSWRSRKKWWVRAYFLGHVYQFGANFSENHLSRFKCQLIWAFISIWTNRKKIMSYIPGLFGIQMLFEQ